MPTKTVSRVIMLAMVGLACDGIWPTTGCACSPIYKATVTGSVTDPEGGAVSGSRVVSEIASYGECASGMFLELSDGRVSGFTNAVGTFALELAGGGHSCWRLWAEAPAGSELAGSDTIVFDLVFGAQNPVPNGGVFTLVLR